MVPKITITTQHYFEDVSYYTGWGLLVIGFLVLLFTWYVGVVMLLLGIIVTTTTYKLVIDTPGHMVHDYMLFLGFKLNMKVTRFEKIQYVEIRSNTYSQKLNMASLSSTVRGTLFSAYLVTDKEKFFLGDSKVRGVITDKADVIAAQLNVALKR